MKYKHLLIVLSTVIGATSCASVSAPEGGPKDETAPKFLKSEPVDQGLNVESKKVTLFFDEEIQPNNLTKELLITPDNQNKYKVKTDKNQISIEFERSLISNTTYTLNFREGITDITEKNKAKDVRISFSTGSYIDSSKVKGSVVDLKTQKAEAKAIVGLYPINDTLSVKKHKPYYQTETDKEGNFSLSNIKEGEYNIYALVEKNNNAYYDTEDEKIAYLTQPIKITPNSEPVKLQLTKFDTKRPILLRREIYTDRFIANYNEGIRKVSIKVADTKNDSLNYKIGSEGKDIEMFKTSKFKGGKTIISVVDSSGNIAADTVDIKFEGKRNAKIKGATVKVVNNRKGTNTYKTGDRITLELETPIEITGKMPLTIMSDSITLKKLRYPEDLTLDLTKTEITFKLPLLKNKSVNLLLDSTQIKPIEGKYLSFKKIPITLEEAGGSGNIIGNVDSKFTSYTIQLLTSEFKFVEEVKNKKTFQFKNIQPGKYLIRVLVDENNNKEWEPGTPDFKNAPEKVYLYSKPLDVRANWDLEGITLEF